MDINSRRQWQALIFALGLPLLFLCDHHCLRGSASRFAFVDQPLAIEQPMPQA
jgi:hypothetical protein